MKDKQPNLSLTVGAQRLNHVLNRYSEVRKIYGNDKVLLNSDHVALKISTKTKEFEGTSKIRCWYSPEGNTKIEANVNLSDAQRAIKFLTAGDQDRDQMTTQIEEREGCIVLSNPEKMTSATIPATEQAKPGVVAKLI